MDTTDFLVVAVFVVGFGLVSGRFAATMVTPPMIFTAFGVIVGSDALGLIDIDIEDPLVETIMSLALILVLFTDAARIDLMALRERFRWPFRVLAIGLPLTMAAGAVLGLWLLPGLAFAEALVLAVVLAPTDAALGQVVVSSPRVPAGVRQTLNVESGLNDGLALPVLLVALAFAAVMGEDPQGVGYWVRVAAQQLGVGITVGIGVGYFGGRTVSWATRRSWMSSAFQRLSALGLALTAFGLTDLLGGSGFIAAFVAGLTLGNTARPICTCLYEFAEAEGQLLTLMTFMFFGAAAVVPAFGDAGWREVAYALGSLTVVRMVPVVISLAGAKMRRYTKAFIAWFGPRGIASLLFGLLMLRQAEFPAQQEVFTVVSITVLLSIVLHGLTAVPAANRYAEEMKDDMPEDMLEVADVPELPLRVPFSPGTELRH